MTFCARLSLLLGVFFSLLLGLLFSLLLGLIFTLLLAMIFLLFSLDCSLDVLRVDDQALSSAGAIVELTYRPCHVSV